MSSKYGFDAERYENSYNANNILTGYSHYVTINGEEILLEEARITGSGDGFYRQESIFNQDDGKILLIEIWKDKLEKGQSKSYILPIRSNVSDIPNTGIYEHGKDNIRVEIYSNTTITEQNTTVQEIKNPNKTERYEETLNDIELPIYSRTLIVEDGKCTTDTKKYTKYDKYNTIISEEVIDSINNTVATTTKDITYDKSNNPIRVAITYTTNKNN